MDLILSGTSLFKKIDIKTSVPAKNHVIINDLAEFKETFAFYFAKGSAAERSFANLDDFNTVLDTTKDLKKNVSQYQYTS